MKKVFIWLLAMLLIFTGCAGLKKVEDIRISDTICPYFIHYNKGVLEVTLQINSENALQWQVNALPDDICRVAEISVEGENMVRYDVTGVEPGATQLTFTALQEEGAIAFVLTLIVDVDSAKRATVRQYEHQERQSAHEELNGLTYQWNVDVDGVLSFNFTDTEDMWFISNAESTVFRYRQRLSTSSGCQFSLQAVSAGQDTVVLTGENTQRVIHVVVKADENGKLEVVSVQEQ